MHVTQVVQEACGREPLNRRLSIGSNQGLNPGVEASSSKDSFCLVLKSESPPVLSAPLLCRRGGRRHKIESRHKEHIEHKEDIAEIGSRALLEPFVSFVFLWPSSIQRGGLLQQHQFLRHGGMDSDALIELLFGQARFHSNRHNLHDLWGIGADHVRADDSAARVVDDQLV